MTVSRYCERRIIVPKQRVFGGKVYFLFDWCATKEEAAKEAMELKTGTPGWFVRVVPAGEGYQIWRR